MYRLSEELAKTILSKIKAPEIESSGLNAFKPKNLNSIGVIDPTIAMGTEFHYVLESPLPIIYPELPFIPVGIKGYFLYKKEELLQPMEPWLITEALINPLMKDHESQIDVQDCTIVLPNDVDKLTIPVKHHVNTLERLIELEPLILDCLNLNKK